MSFDSDPIKAWSLWLDECAPAVHLGDEFGRAEFAELLAAIVEVPVPGQPMAYATRERWWAAWLRVEGDRELDLEVDSDRARLAVLLAGATSAAPFRDGQGRWRVYGERARR